MDRTIGFGFVSPAARAVSRSRPEREASAQAGRRMRPFADGGLRVTIRRTRSCLRQRTSAPPSAPRCAPVSEPGPPSMWSGPSPPNRRSSPASPAIHLTSPARARPVPWLQAPEPLPVLSRLGLCPAVRFVAQRVRVLQVSRCSSVLRLTEVAGNRLPARPRPVQRRPGSPPPASGTRDTARPHRADRRPRADVTDTPDGHLRQLTEVERRHTGHRDGDQRPPPRHHDPGRLRPFPGRLRFRRSSPRNHEHLQLGDDAEDRGPPPHRTASRRARSGKPG